ncbi:LysR family transcriptional regulator [Neoasaia chiangmaiensis NBRC 101099]|nr:LysR family transcriptional regulator [Neoasaia chiangmaiensis NBRC 101099]GEN14526.1 LysR family transcriptional regulator [Neoasaia chiangmaiensis]
MGMTLEQLRIFVAVAEREHITHAAQALNLTPSSVSHAVATLESHLRIKLFSRIGRTIELTRAGRIFHVEAAAVLARAEAARDRLLDFTMLRTGTLHLHASQTIAAYWLPKRLNLFRAQYPDITLTISARNTAEVCAAIRDGIVGLGLIEGESTEPTLTCQTVAADRLLLAVSPRHPWANRTPAPHELDTSEWVLRETGSGTRSAFVQALHAIGVDAANLPIAMELPSNEAVASAVETGDAATVLSASVLAGRLEAGLLHHVPFPLPERPFQLIRHPERELSPVETAFLTIL